MINVTEDNAVLQKTRELCQTMMEQPEFKELRQRIDAFLEDENARTQLQGVTDKGEYLQHKQQQGVPLTDEEIQSFESEREALFANPVAKGFLDAQQEMHRVQESVGQYLAKTFELGRMPDASDFESGSCGTGCGCH